MKTILLAVLESSQSPWARERLLLAPHSFTLQLTKANPCSASQSREPLGFPCVRLRLVVKLTEDERSVDNKSFYAK